MKNTLIAITMLLVTIPTIAQGLDIRDYFYRNGYDYPNGGYFYASRDACFYSYILKGSMEEYEEWALNDGKYTLTWKYQVRQGSGYNWNTISMAEHVLDYKAEAVYSTYQTYYNQFSPKGNYQHDKITLLALPEATGPRTWQETKTDDKYKCSAQWAYVTDGDSFYEQVIKVSKTQISTGITESSYWAKYYGKIWETWKKKGEDPFTVKQRRGIAPVREITEEECIKGRSMLAFLKEHKGEKHSIAKDFPDMYKELEDDYAKCLVDLFPSIFPYYVGSSYSMPVAEWINYAENWRGFSLDYSSTIQIGDEGCKCVSPSVGLPDNSYDPRVIKMYLHKGNWAKATVDRWTETKAFQRPSAVEPVSGYELFFPLEDEIKQKLAISSYRLQIKRKKNEYLLKEGDAAVWAVCKSALLPSLEEQYLRDKKSTLVVRLIKFSSGHYTRYSLVEACNVHPRVHGYLECHISPLTTE